MSVAPHVMEVRLNSIHQLFNSTDPSPFVDRDLDHDAEELIVACAQEASCQDEFQLVIHLEDYAQVAGVEQRAAAAVRNFFDYRTQMAAREYKRLMREGSLSLVIGLLFLGICLLASRYVNMLVGDHALGDLASQGLIVGGCIAMWRPLEIFLYSWWPVACKRGIFARLARMDVQLKRAVGMGKNDVNRRSG